MKNKSGIEKFFSKLFTCFLLFLFLESGFYSIRNYANKFKPKIGINVALYKCEGCGKEVLREAKKIGIKDIAIHFSFYQESLSSNKIYWGNTKKEVEDIIKEAKKNGMSIMLKPAIDPKTGPRTKITPNDLESWFKNYESLMMEVAKLARDHKVEMLSIGCELDSLVSNKDYQKKFFELEQKVREVYNGKIIYCANINYPKDFQNLLVFDEPAIDAYFRGREDFWTFIYYLNLTPLGIFSEFGYPHDPKDQKRQKKNYENFFLLLKKFEEIKDREFPATKIYLWTCGNYNILKDKEIKKIIKNYNTKRKIFSIFFP